MSILRTYLPSLILLAWSLAAGAGIRGDVANAIWLAVLAAAVAVHIRDTTRRHHLAADPAPTAPTAVGRPHARRATDRPLFGLIRVRENWYRDLWLFGITAIVLVSVIKSRGLVDDINQSRLENSLRSCLDTESQNAAIIGVIRLSAADAPPDRQDEVAAFIAQAEQKFPSHSSKPPLDGGLSPRQEFCRRQARERVRP